MRKSLTIPPPGPSSNAERAWSSITSVSGQAAEVRVMSRVATLSSSTWTPYSRPRSTTLIPNSGSTTSFIASSMSATVALVAGSPMTHLLLLRRRPGRRVLERHPGQQRALDPRRVLCHPGERHPVLQQFLVRLHPATSGDHLREGRVAPQRLGQRPAVHQFVQHAGGGPADRAPHPLVRDGHPPLLAGQPHPYRDLVPAGRVDLVGLTRVRLLQAHAARLLGVVQDDLPVKVVHAHAQPNTFRTCSSPRTSASTSDSVL